MIELVSGRARLGIDLERGGRLSSLCLGDREVLVGPPDATDRSIEWGSFLMAPWVGRLEDGVFDFDGRRYVMPATLGRHAIHGVVHDRPWTATRVGADAAELACDLGPAGWPFGGVARQRFTLEPTGVLIEAEVEAERRMPAALGWHPWFRREAPGPRLRVDADEVLQTRAMIPTGRRVPVRGMTDLRPGNPIAGRHVDHAYVDPRSPARRDVPRPRAADLLGRAGELGRRLHAAPRVLRRAADRLAERARRRRGRGGAHRAPDPRGRRDAARLDADRLGRAGPVNAESPAEAGLSRRWGAGFRRA